MTGKLQLRHRDATAVLELAGALADCESQADLDAHVRSLKRLVAAEGALMVACEDWGAVGRLEAGDREIYTDPLLATFGPDWREHPVVRRDLIRPSDRAHRLSDFDGLREFRNGRIYASFYRALGMDNELSAQVAFGPAGSSCCVVLHRSGHDFSDRDVAVIDALRPHLRAARTRIVLLQRLEHEHDAVVITPDLLAGHLPITAREAEVLTCLADGRTNDGIAYELGISRHTVLRHVERIYWKLGVHTRAAATRAAVDACMQTAY